MTEPRSTVASSGVDPGSGETVDSEIRTGGMPPEGENTNPYVGPRALKPGELIFGRDRDLLDLRDLLIAERIVLLYSPWGAGKTSLIQAGLIPEMEREEFDVLPIMRIGREPARPAGNRYVTSALVSLEENLAPAGGPLPSAELATLSIADYLEMRKGRLRWNSTLLIFDQFEEILTTDPVDQEAKAQFFSQVGAVLRDAGRWALFSIREDYVAALDPYTRAVPTRLKSTFRLGFLAPAEARAAIEKPAGRLGVTFAPEATTQLVDDLRRVLVRSPQGAYENRLGLSIEPVHLQVVCFQLWEKPRANPSEIGTPEITAIGDVDSALGEYYADRVNAIATETGVKEKVIREWFDRSLITDAGIRTEVMWKPGGSEGVSDDAIGQLDAAHLIRREERRDATWLELSHTRLVTPIRTSNARWFVLNRSFLQQQAAMWRQHGRSESLCLRDRALVEGEEWAAGHLEELTNTDREFLTASREKEDLRSGARRRRWLTRVIIVAVFMAILAAVAWLQRNEALEQKGKAEKSAKIDSARSLAALAYRMFDERLDLGTLLAYEASRRLDLPDTRGTLLAATIVNPRLVSFLHGHQSPIGAVAFTPNGKLLAVGDFSGRIVLWNVETHRPEHVFPKFFNDAVRAIAFSADGKYMAASSKDGQIVQENVATGEQAVLSIGADAPADTWSVVFSPDSALLASADLAGRINIWDVATRTRTLLTDTAGDTRTVAFSATGSFLATGNSSGNVLVWERHGSDWALFDTFSGAVAPEPERKRRDLRITSIAFSPKDDNLLASGSKDWTVNLRDVAGKRNVAQGKHWGSVNSLAFAPDGNRLVSGAQDGMLRLWQTPKEGSPDPAAAPAPVRSPLLEQIGRPFTGHVGWVLTVAFSPDGRTLASGGIDREAILWDTQIVPEGPASDTTSGDFVMGLSPAGRFEVAGYTDGRTVGRDRTNGKEFDGPAHNKPVKSINFSRDGRFMLSSSSDKSSGMVIVSDLNSPGAEGVRLEIGRQITFATVSPDGKMAAVAVHGGEILLWDIEKREQIGAPLEGLEDVFVYAVAFSPDGKRVAAGGTNQCARIWDLDTRKQVKQSWEHNGSVRAAAFSPDGAILATASGDNTVLLSDPATGKPLAPPLVGHRGPVIALAFRPDGKMLASGGEDKSVVLWNMETRQQASPRMVKHRDAVRALAFSEGGDEILSVSSLEDAIVWNLDLSSLATVSRLRANRNLTKPEWKAYMGGEPYRKTWPDLPEAGENVAPPEK